jgi:uncharacterized protein (TIRG00374 family)
MAKEIDIRRGHLLKFIIGFLITIGCLMIALWGIEWEQIQEGFQRANYSTLPILIALLFFVFWLKAIRWRLLLQPLRKLSTKEVVPSLMIGFMGNNVLPAHLGELIRIFVLGREFSLSKAAVFSSVVLERLFDMVVILLFLLASLLLVDGLPSWVTTTILLVSVFSALAILFLLAYLFWTQRFIRATRRVFSFLPERLGQKLTEGLEAGVLGLASIQSGGLAFWIVLTSILQWALMAGMVYVSLWSFGLHLTPFVSFVIIAVSAIGVSIPSAPGFFGIIQLCFWVILQLFGVDKADAFASSMYFHLSNYIPVTLLGLYYLNRRSSMYFHLSNYIPVTLLGLYYLNRRGLDLWQFDKEAAESKDPILVDSGTV